MPIHLELIDEGRVLKLDMVSPWDMNDLFEMFAKANDCFDSSNQVIHTLVDVSKMGGIPAGALRARNSPFLSHPHSGFQIIVGASPYAKTMADTLFRLTNFKRVRFYATMEEAWQFIESVQPVLAE